MIFNNKGKGKKERWFWETKKIGEVKTFKYLGFTFNTNGNYNNHIKELSRKDKKAACKVWVLGERLCKNDFRRRWILYKYLVQSVIGYGVEIWGWEKEENWRKLCCIM